VAQLADRCLTHVKNRTGMMLDFKIETLGVLDFFIRDILTEEGGGVLPPVGDHRRVETMHLFAPAIGAYFGEVVRHTFPCRWRTGGDDPKEWIIEFIHVPLRFNPVGAAAEAVVEQYIDPWGCSLATAIDETEALTERLAAAPPIPEDEFFQLTTRLEVLQISSEWLRINLNAKRKGRLPVYSEEDYDTLFES
jgi:hypothetical protein